MYFKPMTEKQRKVYNFMKENQVSVCPTYREIATKFKITVKGAYDHVQALYKKGYLKKVQPEGDKSKTKMIINNDAKDFIK